MISETDEKSHSPVFTPWSFKRPLLCVIGVHSWGIPQSNEREVDEMLEGGLSAIVWRTCKYCKCHKIE